MEEACHQVVSLTHLFKYAHDQIAGHVVIGRPQAFHQRTERRNNPFLTRPEKKRESADNRSSQFDGNSPSAPVIDEKRRIQLEAQRYRATLTDVDGRSQQRFREGLRVCRKSN